MNKSLIVLLTILNFALTLASFGFYAQVKSGCECNSCCCTEDIDAN